MERLIDAKDWDSFYADMGYSRKMWDSYDIGYMDALDRVDDWVDAQPTVDAVPVVRCCQCSRRYDADECPMCHLVEGEYNEYTADDGFCDRGEMRTDEV